MSSKGKKRSKPSRVGVIPTLSKRKKKVTIEKLVPLNVIEPSPTSLDQHTSPIVSFGQQAPTLPVRDSRKMKGVINDIVINVEGVALYMGIILERLDHYMDQLLYVVHEKQLYSICEDMDAEVILNCLMF